MQLDDYQMSQKVQFPVICSAFLDEKLSVRYCVTNGGVWLSS